MSRRKLTFEERPRLRFADLAAELCEELKSSHESVQPMIEEQQFKTGLVRVSVIWDKWDHVPQEDRSATILRAYELAEGEESRNRIALPIGLTVPEAHASGMLPFRIIPALRKTDPVTLDQCRAAMIAAGASTLLGPGDPLLLAPTEEEAEACVKRLADRLPGSEPVWVVTKEIGGVGEWSEPEPS